MGTLRVQIAERHPTDPLKIRLTFNEAPNTGDVVVAANYAVDHGVTVSAAAQTAGSALKVDLTVSALSKAIAYKVTVSNVRDAAGGVAIISPNNEIVFIWLGVGDINLNGVPEAGGLLNRVSRALVGNFPLGYNVLGDIDVTQPVISNVSPAAGTPILRTTPWGFNVTDDAGNIARTNVYAYFPASQRFEVVYYSVPFTWSGGTRPAGFGPQYGGSRDVITKGYRFSNVTRKDGWPSAPVFVLDPIDSAGNEVET